MAWVRRARTASGATAVQIAESVAGRRRIVRHVGSAHDEAELGLLIDEAHRLLADDAQGVLDLGITTTVPRATMLPSSPPVPTQAGLFPGPAAAPGSRQLVARPRVLKTSSGLLYDTLAGVYSSLGFDVVNDVVFRDLVIARVVEPTSLLDVDRVLAEMGRVSASLSTRKRTLRRAQASAQGGTYRDQIAAACFNHALTSGDVSLVLYDVTTLYFEAEKEDDLRKVGYSKERRVDPQIVVGLLVDRTGSPWRSAASKGNKAETHTIVPIIKQFQDRHDMADMVVVADAGMLSAANLTDLDEAGLRFIVGSRVTKAPIDLASHFRWHGDAFTDGQVIDTITPEDQRAAIENNDPTQRAEPVWDPDAAPGVVAGGVGLLRPNARSGTTRRSRCRRTAPATSSAGEKTARTPRFVKTANGEHSPRRGLPGPRPSAGRAEGLRHQHRRRR